MKERRTAVAEEPGDALSQWIAMTLDVPPAQGWQSFAPRVPTFFQNGAACVEEPGPKRWLRPLAIASRGSTHDRPYDDQHSEYDAGPN